MVAKCDRLVFPGDFGQLFDVSVKHDNELCARPRLSTERDCLVTAWLQLARGQDDLGRAYIASAQPGERVMRGAGCDIAPGQPGNGGDAWACGDEMNAREVSGGGLGGKTRGAQGPGNA